MKALHLPYIAPLSLDNTVTALRLQVALQGTMYLSDSNAWAQTLGYVALVLLLTRLGSNADDARADRAIARRYMAAEIRRLTHNERS